VGECVHIQSRADSDDGSGMMTQVMMVIMTVLVMVIIVSEGLRQVDSVFEHSCQTFHKFTDFHRPKALCG